jgi:hypothetical protein
VDQQSKLHCRHASQILTRAGFDAAYSNEVADSHHEIEPKALIHARDRALGAQTAVMSTGSQKRLDPIAYVALLRAARRRFPT